MLAKKKTKSETALQAIPLKALIERVAVAEHRTLFVMGEEEESLKQDSCSFPTPAAYEHSHHPQILAPTPHTPLRPAERALATHVEVTEGK